MTEAERGDVTTPPPPVGERLRLAREEIGLALPEVASRTRVPLRHLEAIERSDYAGLPSATYAVGFVKAYARAIGADEVALAHDARIEVARTIRATAPYQPYAMADPTRVPSRTTVIVAAGVALAVAVLAILWFASGTTGGETAPNVAVPPVAVAVPAAAPSPAPVTAGEVTLTATDEVWMRVYDATNQTLYLGTMKPGETFTVPANANDPMINVGRPDKLRVTLNGSLVAPLGTGERAIKDVRVGGAALAARANGVAPAPVAETPPPPVRERRASRPTPRRTPRRERPEPSPSATGPVNLLPSGFASATPAP